MLQWEAGTVPFLSVGEATSVYIHIPLSLFTKQVVLKTIQILKRECTQLDVIKRL